MKKIMSVALCLAMVLSIALLSAGCGSSQPTISVYNWGEYIDMDVLKQFEEETGIRVKYDTFGSNEEGAYAFMNYMLSEQAQQIMVNDMAAIPLIDTSKMDMTGYEDLQGLDVSNFRILSIGDLGTQFNERWDNEIGSIG